MYGRMQFADYIVSYALQVNTDCLQRLEGGVRSAGALSAKDVGEVFPAGQAGIDPIEGSEGFCGTLI